MERLQSLLATIPKGKITTYAEVARALDCPRGARAVGNLLNRNPDPDRFPCCKVIKSNGEVGGYANGTAEKIERLSLEGIEVRNGRVVDFEQRVHRF